MQRRRLGLVATLIVAASFGSNALAADMPLKAPPIPPPVEAGTFYFEGDGSYRRVPLPSYGLGIQFTNLNANPTPATGATDPFDPRAQGAGGNLRLGYIFRDGTFPAMFGSNVRLEGGASYFDAKTNQLHASAPQGGCCGGNGVGYVPLMLNGTFTDDFSCAPATPCSTSASLATQFQSWRGELKALSDFKSGQVTLTPSAALFVARSRTNQQLSQALFNSFLGVNEDFYSANTSLRWTDWGAMVGLKSKVDLTPWLSAVLGGQLGFAARNTSLFGADSYTVPTFPASNTATAIAVSATTTPFLANAEASIILKPTSTFFVRGFAGLDYDSRVPGILAPTASRVQLGNGITTPAGIKYASETSYYAGAGITVLFASR